MFDVTSKSLRKCKKIADFPKGVKMAAGALVSDTPLLCGGVGHGALFDHRPGFTSNCYAYDRKTNRWNVVANIKNDRYNHAAVAIAKRLWITGGDTNGPFLASTEYIHLDGTVQQGPDLPFATAQHCMVTLHDGRVMVIGGVENMRVGHF